MAVLFLLGVGSRNYIGYITTGCYYLRTLRLRLLVLGPCRSAGLRRMGGWWVLLLLPVGRRLGRSLALLLLQLKQLLLVPRATLPLSRAIKFLINVLNVCNACPAAPWRGLRT